MKSSCKTALRGILSIGQRYSSANVLGGALVRNDLMPNMVRNRTKRSPQTEILHALRQAILAGQLQPGDPVLEMELARRHQVSQTTVREVLVRLEHSGLVRRVPNIGTFVTQLSPQELREHLRLRVLLESLAAEEAAGRMDSERFRELDKLLDKISRAASRNAYFEAAQADLEFHRYIWECSGDGTLYRVLDRLTVPVFAFASMWRRRHGEDLEKAVRAHDPIVSALKGGDPAGIRQAVHTHIETSYWEFLGAGFGQPHDLDAEMLAADLGQYRTGRFQDST